MEPGVDIAGPGSHDEAFEGAEPHARLDAAPPEDGGGAAAVAEVGADDASALAPEPEAMGGLVGDRAVGSAVKSVAADPMLGVERVGHGIEIGPGRQTLVEGRIEDRHLGERREGTLESVNPHQVEGIVEWGHGRDPLDARQHLGVDANRLAEALAPVDDAVADSGEFADEIRVIGEFRHHGIEGGLGLAGRDFLHAGQPPGSVCRVHHGEFDRRGAAVQGQPQHRLARRARAPGNSGALFGGGRGHSCHGVGLLVPGFGGSGQMENMPIEARAAPPGASPEVRWVRRSELCIRGQVPWALGSKATLRPGTRQTCRRAFRDSGPPGSGRRAPVPVKPLAEYARMVGAAGSGGPGHPGGGRTMLTGYNTNCAYRGVTFHVQTEDSGRERPRIATHLFHGGTILASETCDYAESLDSPDLDQEVKGLMEAQHKAMLRRLVAGELDSELAERLGPGVFPA